MSVGNFAQGTRKKPISKFAWAMTAASIGAIWLGVILSGTFAPDMVTGSQHEHLAMAAGGDWIWGLVATAVVVLAVQKAFRAGVISRVSWTALALGVAAIWAFVALVSAFAPVWVTGTDPTIIPASAMGAPILGTFLTWFACMLFRSSFE